MRTASEHLESALRQARGSFGSIVEAGSMHPMSDSLRELLKARTAVLAELEGDLLRDVASAQAYEAKLHPSEGRHGTAGALSVPDKSGEPTPTANAQPPNPRESTDLPPGGARTESTAGAVDSRSLPRVDAHG